MAILSSAVPTQPTDKVWTALADMGNHMAELAPQVKKLATDHAIPQHNDLAEMTKLTSELLELTTELMHLSISQEQVPSTSTVLSTSNRRRLSVKDYVDANKRACFGGLEEPFQDVSLAPVAPLSQTPSAVVPYSVVKPALLHAQFVPTTAVVALPFQTTSTIPITSSVADDSPAAPQTEDATDDDPVPLHEFATGTDPHEVNLHGLDEDMVSFLEDFGAHGDTQDEPQSEIHDGTQEDPQDDPQDDTQADPGEATVPAANNQIDGLSLGDGEYLNKLVAHACPMITLREFILQNDINIICLFGRGGHNNFQGNKNFRSKIDAHFQAYHSTSKEGRENLTNSLVEDFTKPNGWIFLKSNERGEWELMGRKEIRSKVSQRFRDAKPKPRRR